MPFDIKEQTQELLATIKFEDENPIKVGGLYKLTHYGVYNVFKEPDINSPVLTSIEKETCFIFLDIAKNIQMTQNWKFRFVRIAVGEVFGYIACGYQDRFFPHSFFKELKET